MTSEPRALRATSDPEFSEDTEIMGRADLHDGGRLYLVRHGYDFEILFGEEQLMGNWSTQSEQALAVLALERLGAGVGHVLIGGLGMGFTLAAALEVLPHHAMVTVAELVPEVVAWLRGPLAHISGETLDDPRVTIHLGDVHDLIADHHEVYDAILLDVDNGPDALIDLRNDRLYCDWGLRAAHAALRPGGVLAVWSSFQDDQFADGLRRARFAVEEVRISKADNDAIVADTIWLAVKQG